MRVDGSAAARHVSRILAVAGARRLPGGVRAVIGTQALGRLARWLAASPAPEHRQIASLLADAIAAGDDAAALALASTAGCRADVRAEKIVSRRYRYLWICNPKVASRSMIAALRAVDSDAELIRGRTLDEVLRMRPQARDYCRFAFIRHPAERAYSFYADKHALALKDRDAHRWFIGRYHGLRTGMEFAEVCRWLDTPCGSDAFADRHWLSQHRQIRSGDGRLPDCLGRYEHLDADWRAIAEKLRMPYRALPRLNARAPGAAAAMDPDTARLLRRRYAEDFRLGGYRDVPAPPRRVRRERRERAPDLSVKTSEDWPGVSVIVPARDAEATLAGALESILSQDYPGALEVIVADGSETSATGDLVRQRFPTVRLVPNPGREIPCGLNVALRAARYPVVARCDTRARWPAGYLARALGTLIRTGAAHVGGRVRPVGCTRFERAVALAMTHSLGAGAARYRIGGPEGPVDTVYLGVFRREALVAVGGFDETLLRNEDYEMNWRLRQRGETVWFDPELAAAYLPKSNFRALARQFFDYGRWKRVVLTRHPRSLRPRQIAAPLLLVALACSAAAGGAGVAIAAGVVTPVLGSNSAAVLLGAAAASPVAYGLFLLGASAAVGLRRRRAEAILLPAVTATMHIAWALGFVAGPPAGSHAKER